MARISVFTDESYTSGQRYFAIGGLWIKQSEEASLRQALAAVRNLHNYHREMKWAKLSTGKRVLYKDWVDVFYSFNTDVAFHSIVIDKTKVDYRTYHSNDRMVGFRKFYYLLLSRRLTDGNDYYVTLDNHPHINGQDMDTIKNCCNAWYARENPLSAATVRTVQPQSSASNDLLQLADVLLGAVAADWNRIHTAALKDELIDHVAQGRRYMGLHRPTARSEDKFNIWQWKA